MGKETRGMLQERFEEIMKHVAPGVNVSQKRYQGETVDIIRTGSPLTTIYACNLRYTDVEPVVDENQNPLKPDSVNLIVKEYHRRPAGLPDRFLDVKPNQRWIDNQQYLFLSSFFAEGEKRFIPKAHTTKIPRLLIIDYAGKTTLEAHLEGMNGDKEKKLEELKRVVEGPLPIFHVKAMEHLPYIIKGIQQYPSVLNQFRETPAVVDDFVDFLSTVSGKVDAEMMEQALVMYAGVKRVYGPDSASICFGDLTLTNILLDENQNLSFIDPKLQLRKQILDLANLTSSPGLYLSPEDYDSLIESYARGMAREMGHVKKERRNLWGPAEIVGALPLPEIVDFVRGIAHVGRMNEALRKMTKNIQMRDSPEGMVKSRYKDWLAHRKSFRKPNEQMRDIAAQELEYTLRNGKKLHMSAMEVEGFEQLEKRLFGENGLLKQEWIYNEPEVMNNVNTAGNGSTSKQDLHSTT